MLKIESFEEAVAFCAYVLERGGPIWIKEELQQLMDNYGITKDSTNLNTGMDTQGTFIVDINEWLNSPELTVAKMELEKECSVVGEITVGKLMEAKQELEMAIQVYIDDKCFDFAKDYGIYVKNITIDYVKCTVMGEKKPYFVVNGVDITLDM